MLLTIKTMDETQLQDLISTLLKNEIQNQLRLVGPARGFNGQKKNQLVINSLHQFQTN